MEQKQTPVYKCVLNNRELFLEGFREDASFATVKAPLLIGKHQKYGGRELANTVLPKSGTKVHLIANPGNEDDMFSLEITMSPSFIQRKLASEPEKEIAAGDTRYIAVNELRLSNPNNTLVMFLDLQVENIDGKIGFKAKQIVRTTSNPDTLKAHFTEQLRLDIYQTFSLQNKRSRNWTPFFADYVFKVDQDSITIKELPMERNMLGALCEVVMSGELTLK